MKWLRLAFLVLLMGFVVLIGDVFWGNYAEARPGGGHSSSGHHSSFSRSSSSSRGSSWWRSSRSSSSSSSSGWYGHSSLTPDHRCDPGWDGRISDECNSENDYTWIWIALFIALLILIMLMQAENTEPKMMTSRTNQSIKDQQAKVLSEALAVLQTHDPYFSKILLMDFVHLLFTKLYRYAGRPEASYLTPFLGEKVLQQYPVLNGQSAEEVVINGIQWEFIAQNAQQDSISLLIDANYTQQQHHKSGRYAVTERWLLVRQSGLLSPEPQKMQALSCPQCGVPAHFNDAGECPYCKTILHKGEAQWYVHKRVIVRTTQLESSSLVNYAEEQGTDLATVRQFDLGEHMASVQQLHGVDVWDDYFLAFQNEVVRPYFLAIYQHWTEQRWNDVRHLLSDRLYEANKFWTDRFKQQNWFNRLDQLKIQRIELARLDVDHFYEAITVRIFASCYDYTEDAQGKIIGGSKRQLRKYSEYWTFVRRIGVSHNTDVVSLHQCPQCGAAADRMGQAAQCGYCGSKISTGEFSWVLFLIMQDDVYEG